MNIDKSKMTESDYRIEKVRGGQVAKYKDSIYEYKIESKLPNNGQC